MLSVEHLQHLLSPYGFSVADVEFIGCSQNYVYRHSDASGRRIIRVSVDRFRKVAQIEGELAWIRKLVDEGINACLPISTLSGEECYEVELDGKGYIVTCFEHAAGSVVKRALADEYLFEKLGILTGKLHADAQSHATMGFKVDRPTWSESRLLNEDADGQRELLCDAFRGGLSRLIHNIQSIPQNANSYGLIHGDLSFGNIAESNGELWLFDFDNCEYGYFLQDLAVVLYDAIYFKALIEFPEDDLNERMTLYWKPFLKGYAQYSPLDEINLLDFKRFFLLREAVLYVHFNRVLTEGQKDEGFHEAQNAKVQHIAHQTHQVDVARISENQTYMKIV